MILFLFRRCSLFGCSPACLPHIFPSVDTSNPLSSCSCNDVMQTSRFAGFCLIKMHMILKTSEQHLCNTSLQLILSFKRGSSSIQSNLDFLSNCHSDFLSLFGCSPHRRLSESFKRAAAAANSPLIAETPPFLPGRALPGSYGHALCHLILCRRGFLAAAFGDEF